MGTETGRLIKIFGTAAFAAVLAACADSGNTQRLNVGASANAPMATTVNRYLWTASLETIDFMPLQSADPVAGVIITDWFASQQAPNERFRANVLILDSALRADALKVRVFRQIRDAQTGQWLDAAINPNTAREFENAILTRARELRLNAVS
ncbi:DUF3576 domain-containing protein [Parvularcula lutaonensis]|uniref:DUF3576 domain-containing protein n=1 Tax=Parvularcula lutaonensis TaxID=491923 RepID=A0ABV7MAG5_9PROT|nr:DUF3576 domain-containing protein [Parvularcula lutaonensis]GGY45968.1 hypothetical protein GCM10007148_13800 [Parvularcula lutaonensis]